MRTLLLLLALMPSASAMDRLWTRMTGQWPVEAPPLVTDWNHDGRNEVLILNRGGQLLLWSAEGVPIGKGQDGTAATLPEGRWTSTPYVTSEAGGPRLLVASVEGSVVALDAELHVLWQHKLAGETAWTMGRPAAIPTASGRLYCFGDRSGRVTCFTASGDTAWTANLEAPIKLLPLVEGKALLIAAGNRLHCLDAAGKTLWSQDAGAPIVSGPVVLKDSVVVGTEARRLVAFATDGRQRWQTELDRPPDYTPTVMGDTLLVRGAFGNLSAVDAEGRFRWLRQFRTKTRAAVVVDGKIVVPGFDQHIQVLNGDGEMVDDFRAGGAVTGVAPVGDGSGDVLAVTATLVAYRLHPGQPRSPYGPTPAPEGVTVSAAPPERWAVIINNPAGALLRVETSSDYRGTPVRAGVITSRSRFEQPVLHAVTSPMMEVRIADAAGKPLFRKSFNLSGSGFMRAYDQLEFERVDRILQPLYVGEVGHAQFVISSNRAPARVRLSLEQPVTSTGKPFTGTIALYRMVETGTFNGESVADALLPLNDANLLSVSRGHEATLWASVDAHGAEPGDYVGKLHITPLEGVARQPDAALEIKVLPLRLPARAPLRLCTWDYVPNNWFHDPKSALDDMTRHGVNIFPRTSSIPKAKVDAAGKMSFDWGVLDTELDRYRGRGVILFQLATPPIDFAAKPEAAARHRAEVAYLHAFRDRLAARGWSFDDYAFYPVDEPGLDYGKVTLGVLLEAGKLIREADPRFRIYTDPVPGLSWRDFERIEPYIDIWCPNMRLVSSALAGDPRMERIRKSKHIWSYECVSQVKSLSPLRYNRANAWRARFFGLSGIGFWTYSTQPFDPWRTAKSFNDEYMLVYPGRNPIPSVRWEAVREGLQDVAAIDLLEQGIARHRKAGTRAVLVEQAERELRIAMADMMELSDAAFIESRDFLAAGDRRLWHTPTDEELLDHHRARIAELTLALQERTQ